MATVKIPYGAISTPVSNPGHKGHNGAETKFKGNPDNDPMIIYQGNGDTSATVHDITDTFVSPEFLNSIGALIRYKDFLHYKDTLTAGEIARIQNFVT